MKKSVGRPLLNETAATLWVGLRVTPAQRRDLRLVATENQTDVTGVIREAVNEYVADFRDLHPVFRRTKL